MLEVFRKTSIFIGGCWCCARPVPRKAKSLQGMRIQGTIFPNPHFFQEHGTMRHWLFKSEPDCYSFTDLENAPGQTTSWDGVRNYQARNFMRDDMKKGDLGFFYHSGKNPEIAGIVEIVREGHPDITAQDRSALKEIQKACWLALMVIDGEMPICLEAMESGTRGRCVVGRSLF